MKTLLRNYLINVLSLWAVAQIIPSLIFNGGLLGLAEAGFVFMIANFLLVPLMKILLLPLNLLTFGLFAWVANVLALYILMKTVNSFTLLPYFFPGANLGMLIIPATNLTTFQAVIVVSFLLAIITHFLHWLILKH
ncbi:hypothetical protein A3H85_01515 [Candidatus Daviesbacteria bacterium RIFCSPLOWO2_02_FULL_40_8]|uniref:Integral membrane protein n=1 Tax=Candidatus Daviesbacteria bacterium RIFCSPLOWO2_01_FULL_40_24 TaxID=1797787 RepID=A0A1F5MJX1_9BACT|nr:MAG: hypothetical protein A2780_01240 [Candidatus Daviesbacteria bacterium RIFCSPHIGHO2_01_FULL_41_45]OGE34423.1 MAG: hypothetical protein A3C32_03690 [Candidatus Daviesbacteria bacterium RIFCSPHIGHO2_02_FULL_41_14]OGE65671.1 MAG: hypothetical protein A3B49_03695 [Candidatus Daviesbacteria bacterium RIFCSPLOWO2_01_FULL_40_24]OGE66746.1 MAG: hypothetical protein A3H85_01515 [Candidatus Daviesbacteria bacterium RIFCSPLOWO2_02_FULL_40_8]